MAPFRPRHMIPTITAHLGLEAGETAIPRFLVLQQRRGAITDFATVLKREVGLPDEAVISWCCSLDEAEV